MSATHQNACFLHHEVNHAQNLFSELMNIQRLSKNVYTSVRLQSTHSRLKTDSRFKPDMLFLNHIVCNFRQMLDQMLDSVNLYLTPAITTTYNIIVTARNYSCNLH